ncbi:MAG: hypothetical protein A2Z77_06670 [Chloroflexi bacterium RBG_13_51_36]|nr:MAG: hypothetical protein A2Z77_06670 [Chloroflexi bacterium RBG_13_51_36]
MLIIFGALSWYIVGFVRAATASDWALAGLPLIGLIVGGGICTVVKRGYWWAFSGAIGLLVAGSIFAAFYLAARCYAIDGYVDPAIQVLRIGASVGFYNAPGLLALVFLVKKKGEFLRLPPSE